MPIARNQILITIEGVKGVWEDLLVISLKEEYEETLDHILSLNDQELEVFWQKSGPFSVNGDADTEFLERITRALAYIGMISYLMSELIMAIRPLHISL